MIKYIAFFSDLREGTFPDFNNFFNLNLNTNKKILIIGPHIKNDHLNIINDPYFDIKILVIFEPIKNNLSNYQLCLTIVNNINLYKLNIFGSVNHNILEKKFKYPLYLIQWGFDYNQYNQFLKANNYIKDCNLEEKKFCCLINRWDPENHRTKIYNKLITIDKIFCPSVLLNNCSNDELNNIGKSNYINKFLFNICSENYDNNNIDGYITEKLMDCCLGCAIPIYAGWFDEYDEKIFNKNRIIFYNSNNNESINDVFIKVKELIDNKEKLLNFYRQPIFCDTAFDTIQKLKNDFLKNIN